MRKKRYTYNQRDTIDISRRKHSTVDLDQANDSPDPRYDGRMFNPSLRLDDPRPLPEIRREVFLRAATARVIPESRPIGYDYYDPRDWLHSPLKTLVCLKRKLRREMIFASGSGGSRKRRQDPRYNDRSKIICRRS